MFVVCCVGCVQHNSIILNLIIMQTSAMQLHRFVVSIWLLTVFSLSKYKHFQIIVYYV